MPISPFAERLLQSHAANPNRVFYNADILGSFYRDTDLQQLDQAYDQLETSGLMEKSGVVVSFFGSPKNLYKITAKGAEQVTRGSAA